MSFRWKPKSKSKSPITKESIGDQVRVDKAVLLELNTDTLFETAKRLHANGVIAKILPTMYNSHPPLASKEDFISFVSDLPHSFPSLRFRAHLFQNHEMSGEERLKNPGEDGLFLDLEDDSDENEKDATLNFLDQCESSAAVSDQASHSHQTRSKQSSKSSNIQRQHQIKKCEVTVQISPSSTEDISTIRLIDIDPILAQWRQVSRQHRLREECSKLTASDPRRSAIPTEWLEWLRQNQALWP